jgi:diacylglycerol kinase (ATP)
MPWTLSKTKCVNFTKMDLGKRIKSFGYAFHGLFALIRSEVNAQIHLGATVLVLVAGFVLKISIIEWLIVLLNIGVVFSAEAFNTAIEKLCDKTTQEKCPKIGLIKDLSAAAVLIASIIAFISGIIIFVPKFIKLF